MQINGVKNRTAKGYACKDVAVWWLFKTFPESMTNKGYSWENYLKVFFIVYLFIHFTIQYLKTEQKESIQTVHKELTRAIPICNRYIDGLLNELANMSISEVSLI